jgi:hypothetical protein
LDFVLSKTFKLFGFQAMIVKYGVGCNQPTLKMTRGYFIPIMMSLYIDPRVMSGEYARMISRGTGFSSLKYT